MNTPVSASKPIRATIPTHDAIDRRYPRIFISQTAPTTEKGTAKSTMPVLAKLPVVQIKQQYDDSERDGHNESEPSTDALQAFVLARDLEAVTGRNADARE